MRSPLIYLITDGSASVENFTEKKQKILHLIALAVELKIPLIQIREKAIPARMVHEIAVDAVKIARDSATKILINDRADIAQATRADGVHLTATSLSARTIRKFFPPEMLIGVSAHTPEKVAEIRAQTADFAVFSPIFATPHKGAAQGVEKLQKICEAVKPFPVIALGGVDETNFNEVLNAGASGFAAIRFLNDEANLIKLSEQFYGE